jgi:phosphoribosyl-AMP cyclohydrolase / phosphoribosyl-ATP pyrophosphohydrolase
MALNFNKYADGLVPAIIQDANTQKVLMLGFMNEDAVERTVTEGKVTFYSRSKQRLWTKGEESGHFLLVEKMSVDCDDDTILIQVEPQGPTCHRGTGTCWGEDNHSSDFLCQLEDIIRQRQESGTEGSYVASLFAKGINKIAQKVGEEAVELVIEAKDDNRELFLGEAADLLFHFMILLKAKGVTLQEVKAVLQQRHYNP